MTRIEVMLRDAKTRRHLKTITVESSTTLVEKTLNKWREPVVRDIVAAIQAADQRKRIAYLKKHTDFFDSKGDDISFEEFYFNEIHAAQHL